MKRWYSNAFRLSRLFILEQIREPLGLFWSLIAPPLLFVFLNLNELDNKPLSSEWYVSRAGWYLSYLALSVSLFGFSMYLIGRRESGFIKSFIQGRKARFLFIFAQFQASMMLSLIYCLLFLFLTCLVFDVSFLSALYSLMGPYLLVSILFTWCSLFVAMLPITFQNANSGVSIVFMTLLILSVAGTKVQSTTLYQINLINPLSIGSQFISSFAIQSNTSLFAIGLLILMGAVGITKLPITPVWSRQ